MMNYDNTIYHINSYYPHLIQYQIDIRNSRAPQRPQTTAMAAMNQPRG